MNTCGGYVVVINVPRAVVVNVALAGFVKIVIGLFKLPIFFLCKNGQKFQRIYRQNLTEFRRNSWVFVNSFSAKKNFKKNKASDGTIPPNVMNSVRGPSEQASDGIFCLFGTVLTENNIPSEPLHDPGYSDGHIWSEYSPENEFSDQKTHFFGGKICQNKENF